MWKRIKAWFDKPWVDLKVTIAEGDQPKHVVERVPDISEPVVSIIESFSRVGDWFVQDEECDRYSCTTTMKHRPTALTLRIHNGPYTRWQAKGYWMTQDECEAVGRAFIAWKQSVAQLASQEERQKYMSFVKTN